MIHMKVTDMEFIEIDSKEWINFAAVISVRPERKDIGNEMDAKLHTAISSFEVNSIISVHKFDDLIVPKFFWFDFLLAASLYKIYGVPVSICDSKILFHNSRAGTTLRALPSRS